MAIHVVRLGTPRGPEEGLRIGTVRRPPRGVKKADYAARDFYDLWLPELAPSSTLISWALSQPWTARRWATFERRYRSEMRHPGVKRLITMLAALSTQIDFSIGCYCEAESRCHRILLKRLLLEQRASLA